MDRFVTVYGINILNSEYTTMNKHTAKQYFNLIRHIKTVSVVFKSVSVLLKYVLF